MIRNTLAAIIAATVFAALAETQEPSGPMLRFTATTENVTGAPDSIRIDLLRWSTDAERDKLLGAWNMTSPPPKAEGAGRGRGGGGGFGGGGFGRGGRGGAAAEAPRRTPEGSLAAELEQAPTVGYIWSSEVAGYAIRYAGKVMAADGTERIILVTGRRLGANTNLWKPVGNAPPSTYEFSVVELRVNAKGTGEGKISVTGKVVLDNGAKMVVPENYAALPVVVHNLKRTSGEID